jgi:hypothetical protein
LPDSEGSGFKSGRFGSESSTVALMMPIATPIHACAHSNTLLLDEKRTH